MKLHNCPPSNRAVTDSRLSQREGLDLPRNKVRADGQSRNVKSLTEINGLVTSRAVWHVGFGSHERFVRTAVVEATKKIFSAAWSSAYWVRVLQGNAIFSSWLSRRTCVNAGRTDACVCAREKPAVRSRQLGTGIPARLPEYERTWTCAGGIEPSSYCSWFACAR